LRSCRLPDHSLRGEHTGRWIDPVAVVTHS
jgi:hypothetical protein